MLEDFDWEQEQTACDHDTAQRSEDIVRAIKGNACHHYDMFGDFLVGRWVMVAEIIDELGERHLTLLGSDGLEPWDALGMTAAVGLR
jgi:hypothetical protein